VYQQGFLPAVLQLHSDASGIRCGDAAAAHNVAVENGAKSVLAPQNLATEAGTNVVSEVHAYGDVVLRFVSGDFKGPFLCTFTAVEPQGESYGLQRLDHCVGNVPKLFEVTDYLMQITGASLHLLQCEKQSFERFS
jgi:4-hydroxyphenylpyruvate dioxygenase